MVVITALATRGIPAARVRVAIPFWTCKAMSANIVLVYDTRAG